MHLCLFQQLNGLEEDVDLDNAELDSLHEDLESRKEVGLGDIAKDLNKNQEAEHDHPHHTRHTHGVMVMTVVWQFGEGCRSS